jgi:hypothetical protein
MTQQLHQELLNSNQLLNAAINQQLNAAINQGVVYTRRGSSSCPSVPGTTLVYAGRAAGTTQGGRANNLCMPPDPQYNLQH